jgi:COMPASS component BRE2
MLGKSGEMGSYTTRANVFAREGQFYYESKVVSLAPPGREPRDKALAEAQRQDKTSTARGSLRVGFCRREHHWSENMGNNAYSYAVACRCGTGAEYGNVRFNQQMFHLLGEDAKDPGDLHVGDVVGLMITLPPLEVHQKVVEGIFNSADYPHLKCGPAIIKPKKGNAPKKGAKPAPKVENKADTAKKAGSRDTLRAQLNSGMGLDIPADVDIIRDRNPFLHKGMTYFECPEYTPHVDLGRNTLNAKNKSVNPETGKRYDLLTEPHPNHELPHLRTLPGSKIEMWVNGKYQGIVWENLFAFLPPASSIEKSNRTTLINGEIDDGLLGYYPAISHYTGGAIECKFDGPWWYGYSEDGPARPDCRPIGQRYQEQIVEDFVSDIVDEVYHEQMHSDPQWMRKRVLLAGALPASVSMN